MARNILQYAYLFDIFPQKRNISFLFLFFLAISFQSGSNGIQMTLFIFSRNNTQWHKSSVTLASKLYRTLVPTLLFGNYFAICFKPFTMHKKYQLLQVQLFLSVYWLVFSLSFFHLLAFPLKQGHQYNFSFNPLVSFRCFWSP